MKIPPSGPNNAPGHSFGVKLNSSATPADSGGSGGPTDRVQLSSLSNYLASALSGSPAHVAKISELETAVSEGQYHVDAYTVSGNIIQHGIEFGASGYLGLST
jgi:flagellar biosynthesis anti-sigma factor FlgM